MTKEIKVGEHSIIFKSNAVTPLYYKQIFKKDLLQRLSGGSGEYEIASEEIPEVGFIMAKQGEGADMTSLSYESYIEWLEGFEPLDLTMSSSEIINVYLSTSIPTSQPKKKAGGEVNA